MEKQFEIKAKRTEELFSEIDKEDWSDFKKKIIIENVKYVKKKQKKIIELNAMKKMQIK